jgi:hypothetical protein
MDPSRDKDTIFTEFISNSLDVEEDIIHLAELLIGVPVVGPGLSGMFYPLVTMLALT